MTLKILHLLIVGDTVLREAVLREASGRKVSPMYRFSAFRRRQTPKNDRKGNPKPPRLVAFDYFRRATQLRFGTVW